MKFTAILANYYFFYKACTCVSITDAKKVLVLYLVHLLKTCIIYLALLTSVSSSSEMRHEEQFWIEKYVKKVKTKIMGTVILIRKEDNTVYVSTNWWLILVHLKLHYNTKARGSKLTGVIKMLINAEKMGWKCLWWDCGPVCVCVCVCAVSYTHLDPSVGIGERVLRHGRLLCLPQTTHECGLNALWFQCKAGCMSRELCRLHMTTAGLWCPSPTLKIDGFFLLTWNSVLHCAG